MGFFGEAINVLKLAVGLAGKMLSAFHFLHLYIYITPYVII